MFESDDYDQILSQFELPVTEPSQNDDIVSSNKEDFIRSCDLIKSARTEESHIPEKQCNLSTQIVETSLGRNQGKENKRKMIHSYFDTGSKRKFPGPAGLLSGSIDESANDNICQMELLSQDTDFSQHQLKRDVFESQIWKRLQQDLLSWNVDNVDSISVIKQQAVSGNLRKRKAQHVTAFVEAVDRSATDPLVILCDSTGNIKSTLHRDGWKQFSAYIASECCALILRRPTVLTTGGTFKKHYLNITLANIVAIYSSAVLPPEDDRKQMPTDFRIVYEEDFTVIKSDLPLGETDVSAPVNINPVENDHLDGLDSSIFLDEIF